MKSYPSLIDGRDADHRKWLHVIRASALLRDEISALKLKRNLDRGLIDDCEDERVVGRVGLSSLDQVREASAAARAAFPEWSRWSPEERLAVATAVGERIRARADEFTDMLVAEGHPRQLAVWEVGSAVEMTSEVNLSRARKQLSEVTTEGGRELRLVRKPDGVVAVHPPHNAPAANSMIALGALIAGNTVIVKAPRSAPLATAWFWREIVNPVLSEWKAPAGTANVICASPNDVLDSWLESDDVDDLMYFGESVRGIDLGNRWHARGKKAILELAGNDGVLVWSDAEVDLAVTALSECFYGSTQICMVPKYAIVHKDVADTLLEKLIQVVRRIRPGYPEDEGSLLSPVMKSAAFESMLGAATDAGAQVLCGGGRIEIDGTPSETGYFIDPTLLRIDGLKVAETLDVVREETFFPLLPLVVVDADTDADGTQDGLFETCVDFMNANRYGLRNSAWIQDPDLIEVFCRRLNNGGFLKINDSHISQAPGLPTHGGTGLTGGPFGEAHFPILRTSHLQAISIASAVRPRESVFVRLTDSENAADDRPLGSD
ncbi:aldehyde dehydrogenase family protein [Nocardia takedensis]|uniref:aldehyde dehydrogenase family protein n=1 Tax=Nocardia takedensis TaxID=259390 RepID=UPI0002E886CB|nr:aldehyde dehydrogenase family protein [Nocardia takedensis]